MNANIIEEKHYRIHDSLDTERSDMELINRFCTPLCSLDTSVREVALNIIEKTVVGWLDGSGASNHVHNWAEELVVIDDDDEDDENGDILVKERDFINLISFYLPAILRLSVNCPFEDVRDKFLRLLEMIKVSRF